MPTVAPAPAPMAPPIAASLAASFLLLPQPLIVPSSPVVVAQGELDVILGFDAVQDHPHLGATRDAARRLQKGDVAIRQAPLGHDLLAVGSNRFRNLCRKRVTVLVGLGGEGGGQPHMKRAARRQGKDVGAGWWWYVSEALACRGLAGGALACTLGCPALGGAGLRGGALACRALGSAALRGAALA